MKKRLGLLLVLIIVLAMAFSLTACDLFGKGGDDLTGVWEYWQDDSVFLTFEFLAGNKFNGKSPYKEQQGTYTIKGNILTMTDDDETTEIFTYKLNGDILTLTDDDNDYEMHRKGTYTPPEKKDDDEIIDDGELTLASLRQAAADTGYEIDDYYSSGSIMLSERPMDGFNVTFAPNSSVSIQIFFWEFKTEAGAQAFKAYMDDPNAMFPKDHIVYGRFVGEVPQGFSMDSDIRAFVESIFAAAGGNNT